MSAPRIAIFLLAVCVLASCSNGRDEYGNSILLPEERVVEVTLKDGTRCAVFADNRTAGGIDCDWKSGSVVESPQ